MGWPVGTESAVSLTACRVRLGCRAGNGRHSLKSPTMWVLPLTLVLLSAGLHASWNLIVKRQG